VQTCEVVSTVVPFALEAVNNMRFQMSDKNAPGVESELTKQRSCEYILLFGFITIHGSLYLGLSNFIRREANEYLSN
jgi:hypothetical protein